MDAADGAGRAFFYFRKFFRRYFLEVLDFSEIIINFYGLRTGPGAYAAGDAGIFTGFFCRRPPVFGAAEDEDVLIPGMKLE